MRKVIRLLLFCTLAAACEQKTLTEENYVHYYSSDDNELSRKIKVGNITYLIKLLPPEYFVLRELSGEGTDNGKFKSRLNELQHNTYFLIKIIDGTKVGQPMAPGEKAKLISYYQNEAGAYFSLKVGNDVIRPSFVNYEDNYGLAPDNRILVCFPNNMTLGGEMTLTYDDQLYSNPGIRAAYSKDELKKMPLLKL